ncbi:MAG: peptide chain release factor N(5)-glutamine methyltransferase [Clostridiales bacterium]|nr:peptide chain release factor N(5)-glutamine methyltransferase [Clostridiales bacterium]
MKFKVNRKDEKKGARGNAPFFYGGQAVLEGVMMVGKSGTALAVREEAGGLVVECKRKPQKKTPFIYKWPIVRGVVGFVNSMATGIKMLSRSAEAAMPEADDPKKNGKNGGSKKSNPKKNNGKDGAKKNEKNGGAKESGGKGALAFALFLGLALAVGLFILLPSWIAGACSQWLGATGVIWQNVIESGARILIFIAYLLIVSLMKDIRRTFMYHGAEHKTINCFEKGGEMTVEGVAKFSKRHNRCGTTFLFFVIIVSIVVFSAVTYLLSVWGLDAGTMGGKFVYALFRTGVRLALLPLVAGLSYELLRLLAKGGDNIVMKILRAPGLALQGLTTREPEPAMIEVALAAFNAAREMDINPNAPDRVFDLSVRFQPFYREYLKKAAERGVEGASVDFLLCGLLNVGRAELAARKWVKGSVKVKAENLLNKLIYQSEPYQYLLGYAEFYGVRVKVTRDTLIPRLDTEVLADSVVRDINGGGINGERFLEGRAGETILQKGFPRTPFQKTSNLQDDAPRASFKILDLCCGSGCIGIAVAKQTGAACDLADVSAAALAVAAENAKAAGVQYESVQGDLFAGLAGRKYDAIVCNPPYIKTADLAALPADVKKEPVSALDGGEDGLEFYRRIALELRGHMNAGARAYFEIGDGQAASVREIFGDREFSTEAVKDLSGKDRVIKVRIES